MFAVEAVDIIMWFNNGIWLVRSSLWGLVWVTTKHVAITTYVCGNSCVYMCVWSMKFS